MICELVQACVGPRFSNQDRSRLLPPRDPPACFSPGSYSAYLQLGRARAWHRALKRDIVRCERVLGETSPMRDITHTHTHTIHTLYSHIRTQAHKCTPTHPHTLTHIHTCGTSGRWLKGLQSRKGWEPVMTLQLVAAWCAWASVETGRKIQRCCIRLSACQSGHLEPFHPEGNGPQ